MFKYPISQDLETLARKHNATNGGRGGGKKGRDFGCMSYQPKDHILIKNNVYKLLYVSLCCDCCQYLLMTQTLDSDCLVIQFT